MSPSKLAGPETIASVTSGGVKIHVQILNPILAKVGNLPVVIYSINGKAREGKSFVLSQFVSFLELSSEEREEIWMKFTTLAKNFSWKGGSDPHTQGETFSFISAARTEIALLSHQLI